MASHAMSAHWPVEVESKKAIRKLYLLGTKVLVHFPNGLVFLDQMVHNEGMQEVAEQVALFPESQIKYEPLGNRVFPTPEKPYGELVEPDVVAIATRASDDLEKLAARVAKANKPKPKD